MERIAAAPSPCDVWRKRHWEIFQCLFTGEGASAATTVQRRVGRGVTEEEDKKESRKTGEGSGKKEEKRDEEERRQGREVKEEE